MPTDRFCSTFCSSTLELVLVQAQEQDPRSTQKSVQACEWDQQEVEEAQA